MLKKILSNFSEDELLSFLSEDSLVFTKNVLFSGETDSDFSKTQLAGIIASTKHVEFVFNDQLRGLLIDRLKTQLFVELFPEFKLSSNDVRPEHYKAATCWASENKSLFARKIGLGEAYNIEADTDSVRESICNIEPDYALYPYQQSISKETFKMLEDNKERVLIHLPTGAGKTRTAMNIASEHLRESPTNVVLWLADREELCSQAFSEFKKSWASLGNRPTTLYGFYSDSTESLGGIDSGFVVAGLHKFLSVRDNDSKKLQLLYKELRKSVTLVIFDEAHKSIAPKFEEVIKDFIDSESFHADLIGLTATPGRSYSSDGLTGEDKKLADFFYNNKVSMMVSGYLSPIDYLVKNGYLAKANFKSLNYDQSAIAAQELKDAGGIETMNALSKNTLRNKRILTTIANECKNNAQIIVFACTVEHGINLATALACMGIRAASIDSKNDSTESRRTKIQQYKDCKLQVLVNFNVLTAGFDAPKTNVTVIAKPMNSLVQYLQMAGRAMRGPKSGGNAECNIYTVMDDIPEFQSINIAFEYWNEMWVEKKDL